MRSNFSTMISTDGFGSIGIHTIQPLNQRFQKTISHFFSDRTIPNLPTCISREVYYVFFWIDPIQLFNHDFHGWVRFGLDQSKPTSQPAFLETYTPFFFFGFFQSKFLTMISMDGLGSVWIDPNQPPNQRFSRHIPRFFPDFSNPTFQPWFPQMG